MVIQKSATARPEYQTTRRFRARAAARGSDLDLTRGSHEEGAPTLGAAPAMTAASPPSRIAYDDFLKVDVRVGTILSAEAFPRAHKPAYKLTIDFGPEIGVKKSSAQITRHYALPDLVGRQVAAVVNFAPRQIGPFMSEVLTLGFPDADGEVVLIGPSQPTPNGGRLF
jgi:tRNA-binding protein